MSPAVPPVQILAVPVDDLLTGGFWIDVHASQQEVACSSIPGKDNLVTIEMNEANESGLSGWATLYGVSEESQLVIYLNPGTEEAKPVQIREMKCTPEVLDPGNFGEALGPKRYNLEFLIHGFSSTLFGAPFGDLVTGELAIVPGTLTGRVLALACGEIPSKSP